VALENFIYSLNSIDTAVEILYAQMPKYQVLTFSGPLGAGKTALIKLLLARCGVQDVVTSPTFTYMAIYTNGQKETFYHFDLYRIQSMGDFLQAGFDEYLYVPGSWSFIEWPEVITPLLTHSVCRVTLDYVSREERSLSIAG
jgi:tRNA threonylcarbamoyladenosine biosynthesis protein TsaE